MLSAHANYDDHDGTREAYAWGPQKLKFHDTGGWNSKSLSCSLQKCHGAGNLRDQSCVSFASAVWCGACSQTTRYDLI